jgi:predicted Rdx family selenoprotein
VELKRGSGGIFDITLDGRLLFSRHATGRHPDASDVAQLVAAAQR